MTCIGYITNIMIKKGQNYNSDIKYQHFIEAYKNLCNVWDRQQIVSIVCRHHSFVIIVHTA